MRLVTVVGAVWLGLAGAARADTYPQIVVDRPLVLLPGMTTVDLGLDFPTPRPYAGVGIVARFGG